MRSKPIIITSLMISVFALSACSSKNELLENVKLTSTQNYKCGNEQIKADYYQAGENNFVKLHLTNKKPIVLTQVISASGARYVGEIYEWWEKGNNAFFTDFMKSKDASINCSSIQK